MMVASTASNGLGVTLYALPSDSGASEDRRISSSIDSVSAPGGTMIVSTSSDDDAWPPSGPIVATVAGCIDDASSPWHPTTAGHTNTTLPQIAEARRIAESLPRSIYHDAAQLGSGPGVSGPFSGRTGAPILSFGISPSSAPRNATMASTSSS